MSFDYHEPQHKTFEIRIASGKEDLHAGWIPVNLPGVCRCEVRTIGADNTFADFEKRQNYNGRMPDRENLALEAELFLESAEHPEWKSLRIGIPLSEIPEKKELKVRYSGTHFQLIAGESVLDEEYPFGDPPGDPGIYSGSFDPLPPIKTGICSTPLHGWSPESPDSWVGDVAVGFFQDEFHLFYLYDRRHHGSKFGNGGHQWGHLATRDFRSWRNDGVILAFTGQWQSFGTGTPFKLHGGLALAYAFHTERFLPPGIAPEGATWAESEDGVHYLPMDRIYDKTRNPSIYNLPDGRFRLLTGYGDNLRLLEADQWPEFKLLREFVLPCGEKSVMRNCLDCPAWFEWRGTHYMLVGFSGMWMSQNSDFAHPVDLAAQGEDLYDGLEVPMVAPFGEDRRILAGWLPIEGWGGLLGIRELVRHEDGILGSRWLEDAMPDVPLLQGNAPGNDVPENFRIDRMLRPGESFRIRLEGVGTPVEFRLDPGSARAELTSEDSKALTLCEAIPKNRHHLRSIRGGVAVDHLRGMDVPYRLRLMVRSDRKWDGSVLDVEIAGCRTMLKHFKGFYSKHCRIY